MSVISTLPIQMNSVQPTTSAVPSASVCPRVTQASQYTLIMSHKGCDCDPNSPDPDSFCPFNQYCKNCKEWDLLTFSLFQSFIIILTPLDVKREKVEDPPLISVSRKAATVTRASPTLTTSVPRTKSAIRKGTDRGKHYCQLPVPVSIDLSVSPSDPSSSASVSKRDASATPTPSTRTSSATGRDSFQSPHWRISTILLISFYYLSVK